MKGFYDKDRCGKAVDLRLAGQEGTRFAGRRVVQHPDFRITVSMDEDFKSVLRPMEVPRGYLSNTERSDGILTNVKRVNGGLGWFALTARTNMEEPHSIIPSVYDRRSPQLISDVNAAVTQCHAVAITIKIWPILFAEKRWTTFTDSSFDIGERQRHQQGWLVCTTNKYVNQERSAPVSVLHTLAKSKGHTKSWESTVGENLRSKLSSDGDDLDQSIVGIDDLDRFGHSHAAKIKSTSQNAACDRKRKSSLRSS